MRHLRNIFNLGIKELRSLLGDKAMLTLIVFSFTVSVYSSATVTPGSLNLAPIAIADMDQSQLSNRIVNSFYRPWFLPPEMITADEMDAGLDAGRYTFAINIPPNFQRDVLAGRQPDIQVNVDATRMSQAFTGNGYIQNIINGEVNSFVARYRDNSEPLVSLETRMRFNPILDAAPDLRIPATISFVASVAQFTPKTVETSDERLKLMFRVKARIPPELLQQHLEYVKTGLPGVAWVRVNEELPWPDDLVVRLPQ